MNHTNLPIEKDDEQRSNHIIQINLGSMVINYNSRSVLAGNTAINLTSSEFNLLWLMAQMMGRTVSRDEIYLKILKSEYDGLNRSCDLLVSRLRKKLNRIGTSPVKIVSVRSEGYLLTTNNL